MFPTRHKIKHEVLVLFFAAWFLTTSARDLRNQDNGSSGKESQSFDGIHETSGGSTHNQEPTNEHSQSSASRKYEDNIEIKGESYSGSSSDNDIQRTGKNTGNGASASWGDKTQDDNKNTLSGHSEASIAKVESGVNSKDVESSKVTEKLADRKAAGSTLTEKKLDEKQSDTSGSDQNTNDIKSTESSKIEDGSTQKESNPVISNEAYKVTNADASGILAEDERKEHGSAKEERKVNDLEETDPEVESGIHEVVIADEDVNGSTPEDERKEHGSAKEERKVDDIEETDSEVESGTHEVVIADKDVSGSIPEDERKEHGSAEEESKVNDIEETDSEVESGINEVVIADKDVSGSIPEDERKEHGSAEEESKVNDIEETNSEVESGTHEVVIDDEDVSGSIATDERKEHGSAEEESKVDEIEEIDSEVESGIHKVAIADGDTSGNPAEDEKIDPEHESVISSTENVPDVSSESMFDENKAEVKENRSSDNNSEISGKASIGVSSGIEREETKADELEGSSEGTRRISDKETDDTPTGAVVEESKSEKQVNRNSENESFEDETTEVASGMSNKPFQDIPSGTIEGESEESSDKGSSEIGDGLLDKISNNEPTGDIEKEPKEHEKSGSESEDFENESGISNKVPEISSGDSLKETEDKETETSGADYENYDELDKLFDLQKGTAQESPDLDDDEVSSASEEKTDNENRSGEEIQSQNGKLESQGEKLQNDDHENRSPRKIIHLSREQLERSLLGNWTVFKAMDKLLSDVPKQATAASRVCRPGPLIPTAPYMTTKRRNCLIIGDSISLGYIRPVQSFLKDFCTVYHAPWSGDGGSLDTKYLLQCLPAMLSTSILNPTSYDVIIFNSGLHDIDIGYHEEYCPKCDYKKNIKELKEKLVATGASVAFADTTPVPYNETLNNRVKEYNIAAREALNSSIEVIDLYTLVSKLCSGEPPYKNCRFYAKQPNLHFTSEGYTRLGHSIAKMFYKLLAKRPLPPVFYKRAPFHYKHFSQPGLHEDKVLCQTKNGLDLTGCPVNTTCSYNRFSGTHIGCCMLPDAVDCGNNWHCCPKGTVCDPKCTPKKCSCLQPPWNNVTVRHNFDKLMKTLNNLWGQIKSEYPVKEKKEATTRQIDNEIKQPC